MPGIFDRVCSLSQRADTEAASDDAALLHLLDFPVFSTLSVDIEVRCLDDLPRLLHHLAGDEVAIWQLHFLWTFDSSSMTKDGG